MTTKVITVLFLFVSKLSLAQCECSRSFDPNVLNAKKRSTGQDTICFTATLIAVGRTSHEVALNKLQKAGLIDKRRYKSAVSFTSDNVKTKMYLPYNDTDTTLSHLLWSNQNMNKQICITGVIYDRLKFVDGKPFFLINKISFPN